MTLAVQDLTISYPVRSGELLAVDDVNLETRPGEFVTIIGPSGCGKSSLLHAMGGMLAPSRGRVELEGSTVTEPDPTQAAFVFQDYSLLPWKTVIENVELGLRFSGVARGEARRAAAEKLQNVGLGEFSDAYPRHLSGGMQQRAAVARALAMEPKYLLMDEPFGALDEQTRRSLGADLGGRLSRSGQGVVLITHSLEEAIYWADRIIVMSARPGRIITEISVEGARPRPLEFMTTPEFATIRAELFSLIQGSVSEAL